MQLQNIHNFKKQVTLFTRDNEGELHINKDSSFYPYYYEPDSAGKYITYDNKKVRKITCSEPKEVGQKRSENSYEADILFPKRYIINNIETFEKSPIKYFFIDIEVLAKEMPNPSEAKYPISCVTIYNSFNKEYRTWYLGDYIITGDPILYDEEGMLKEVVEYIKVEMPDLILAWYITFDYTYLYNRIPDFAKKISPTGFSRYGGGFKTEQTYYPAGISLLDYMILFKRIYMREQSYELDKIAQKYLNETPWEETEFGVLNDIVKAKNINDVQRMVKLEEKFKIIDYYDEIRRFSTCLWEDVTANSKVLDMIILREAHKRNLILPNKSKDRKYEDLQGAYRRAEVGVYHNVYKADVGSMYPNQIINFCLDAQNIRKYGNENTIEVSIGTFVEQNSEALLPYLSMKLINKKNIIKTILANMPLDDENYEHTKKQYDAIKSLVNSLYGVMAFPSFRLYNNTIASAITYLSRGLLKYVEDKMRGMDYNVIYSDTDALLYQAEKDEIILLNNLIQDWSIETYGKTDINISFESEGIFTKILILGKCHYYGYLKSKKGTKTEIKGIEVKRSSSSKFEAKFQEALIMKILQKESQDKITDWIKQEQERIKTLPFLDIAFPCKIGNKKYKYEPIFKRAYNNTKQLVKDFKLNKGELFHYIFVKGLGYDGAGKPINVLALNKKVQFKDLKNYIDWNEIIRRNIILKADTIFNVLGWGDIQMLLNNQTTLF